MLHRLQSLFANQAVSLTYTHDNKIHVSIIVERSVASRYLQRFRYFEPTFETPYMTRFDKEIGNESEENELVEQMAEILSMMAVLTREE